MNEIQINLRQQLHNLKDDAYLEFSSKLNPGIKVMGVRIPILRKIAKNYLKNPDAATLLISPYSKNDDPFLEELMIAAILIANLKINDRFEKINYFFRYLKGWSLCDLLCAELKDARNNLDLYWNFVYPKFFCKESEQQRFAAVMSLNYFTEKKYLRKILKAISHKEYTDYYVSMGVAWLVATLFVKYPDRIYFFLKEKNLYSLTHKQALQKILDSYKVTVEQKALIRKLKEKK